MADLYEMILRTLDMALVPQDIKDNLEKVGEMDREANECEAKAMAIKERYEVMRTTLPKAQRLEKFNEMMGYLSKVEELCDKKVELTNETYELIDKYIRVMDAASLGSADPAAAGPVRSPQEPKKSMVRKRGPKSSAAILSASKAAEAAGAGPSESVGAVVDMPVNPYEPTYCVCQDVSHGEMILCDNSDCQIEWFHFGCVGITELPKGSWYCPKCTSEGKAKP